MAQSNACPYLVSVMVDHLWLYRMGGYCTSGDRPRVPGATKIADVCAEPAHTRCAGYLARRRPAQSCSATSGETGSRL